MESQRTFLFIALMLVSYLLYQQWLTDYNPKTVAPVKPLVGQTIASDVPTGASAMDVPASPGSAAANVPSLVASQSNHLVTVTSKVLQLKIDAIGGDIVLADLLKYPVEQGKPESVHLLSKHHQAQSGLIGPDGLDSKRRPIYNTNAKDYSVMSGAGTDIVFSTVDQFGLQVNKIFTVKPESYEIGLRYEVTNNSRAVKTLRHYAQLKKLIVEPESSMMMVSYNAATYSTQAERYEKYDLEDMQERPLQKDTLGGWVAMQQHYFVASWVATSTDNNRIFSKVAKDGSGIIGYIGPDQHIQPGQTVTMSGILYAGPKNQKALEKISETLKLTVDYGPLWFISELLFWLLQTLYSFVANWGVAIILITIIVKTALYPLTKKQTVSMAKMRNLQPKLQQLKERFGDDRQKMGPAMMDLYRKEGVNPMSGCLPLLLQMPIFLALYWMLMESVELRHAGFIFWITDLASKDPFYVLPVLYGASMVIMQKLQPTPVTDPMQQKVMTWMPVIFSILFLFFPSGLVLYWLVNNIISILQTLYIYRMMEKTGLVVKSA